MSEPTDEDTTQIDRELIAKELVRTAKLAKRLGYPEVADEIEGLATTYRGKPVE